VVVGRLRTPAVLDTGLFDDGELLIKRFQHALGTDKALLARVLAGRELQHRRKQWVVGCRLPLGGDVVGTHTSRSGAVTTARGTAHNAGLGEGLGTPAGDVIHVLVHHARLPLDVAVRVARVDEIEEGGVANLLDHSVRVLYHAVLALAIGEGCVEVRTERDGRRLPTEVDSRGLTPPERGKLRAFGSHEEGGGLSAVLRAYD